MSLKKSFKQISFKSFEFNNQNHVEHCDSRFKQFSTIKKILKILLYKKSFSPSNKKQFLIKKSKKSRSL